MFKAQSWLSFNFFAFFFTWGVFIPYWTAWLIAEKGLTVGAASTIIAAGLFVRSFSTFFLFPTLRAKFSAGTLFKAFALLSLVLLFSFFLFDSFTAMMVAMILFSLVYPLMLPLTESTGAIMIRSEHIQYGRSRSWGSIGYAAALVVVGAVTAAFGDPAIMYVMMAGCFLMIITAFYYTPASVQVKEEKRSVSLKPILKSKRFLTAAIICILIDGSHAAYYNYGFIYLQELGVNNMWGGIILNLAVVAEIAFFAVADRMFRRTRASSMLLAAGLATVIRWAMMFLFPNVIAYVAGQLLHAFTFGLAHYTFIRVMYEEFENKDIPSAQGIYSAFGMGLSSSFLTIAGGYLYNQEPGLAFLGMAVVTIPAILLALYMKKQFEASPLSEK